MEMTKSAEGEKPVAPPQVNDITAPVPVEPPQADESSEQPEPTPEPTPAPIDDVKPAPPADEEEAAPKKEASVKAKPAAPKPPKQHGTGLAIFAAVIIVLGLGAMFTYAYLQSR